MRGKRTPDRTYPGCTADRLPTRHHCHQAPLSGDVSSSRGVVASSPSGAGDSGPPLLVCPRGCGRMGRSSSSCPTPSADTADTACCGPRSSLHSGSKAVQCCYLQPPARAPYSCCRTVRESRLERTADLLLGPQSQPPAPRTAAAAVTTCSTLTTHSLTHSPLTLYNKHRNVALRTLIIYSTNVLLTQTITTYQVQLSVCIPPSSNVNVACHI